MVQKYKEVFLHINCNLRMQTDNAYLSHLNFPYYFKKETCSFIFYKGSSRALRKMHVINKLCIDFNFGCQHKLIFQFHISWVFWTSLLLVSVAAFVVTASYFWETRKFTHRVKQLPCKPSQSWPGFPFFAIPQAMSNPLAHLQQQSCSVGLAKNLPHPYFTSPTISTPSFPLYYLISSSH